MSRVFNGASSASYLTNTSNTFPIGQDNLAICAWIFPTTWGAASGNGPGWIINSGGTGNNAWGLYVSKSATGGGGTLTGISSNKVSLTSEAISVDSVLVLNQWQFVVWQWAYATGVSRLWVNGVEVAYALQTNGNTGNPAAATIVGNGATAGTASGFTGSIDSVAVFSNFTADALTQPQIIQAMGYQGIPSITMPAIAFNYWALLGTTSPEPDIFGDTNYPLTVSNAPQGPNSPGQAPPLPPAPVSIVAVSGEQGATLNVTVSGTAFNAGGTSTLSFSGTGITVNSYGTRNATTLTANITISSSAATTARDVIITNADAQTGTLVAGLTIILQPAGIEKGLFQLIQSDPAVSSLVTMTGGKGLYWVLAPKGALFPLIVLSWVATTDTIAFSGDLGFRNGLLQIDCYSSQYYNSKIVATAVRDLLKSYVGFLPNGSATAVDGVLQTKDWDMPYEEGAVGFVYRALLEFRIWYRDSSVGDTILVDGGSF